MVRPLICFVTAAIALAGDTSKSVTWTGWFSDAGCATGRANSGNFTPTSPECAKKCIKDGTPAVFISETAKAIFIVQDYPDVLDDLGYRIEIQARVNESAKTIQIDKVKRLEPVKLSCGGEK